MPTFASANSYIATYISSTPDYLLSSYIPSFGHQYNFTQLGGAAFQQDLSESSSIRAGLSLGVDLMLSGVSTYGELDYLNDICKAECFIGRKPYYGFGVGTYFVPSFRSFVGGSLSDATAGIIPRFTFGTKSPMYANDPTSNTQFTEISIGGIIGNNLNTNTMYFAPNFVIRSGIYFNLDK